MEINRQSLEEWAKDKPLSILQLDPADRAVLRIAGKVHASLFKLHAGDTLPLLNCQRKNDFFTNPTGFILLRLSHCLAILIGIQRATQFFFAGSFVSYFCSLTLTWVCPLNLVPIANLPIDQCILSKASIQRDKPVLLPRFRCLLFSPTDYRYECVS
jgi:hypothetical protein